jgi:hypothetical protein
LYTEVFKVFSYRVFAVCNIPKTDDIRNRPEGENHVITSLAMHQAAILDGLEGLLASPEHPVAKPWEK